MRPLNITFLLLVTMSTLTACNQGHHPSPDRSSERPCPRASEAASLSASPILDDKPADTRHVESYAECTESGLPYAGRFYETSMNPAEVAAFYRETAGRQGWTTYRLDPSPDPAHPADGEDFLCAGRGESASPRYLELWWPDEDSGLLNGRPEGTVYALDLSVSPRKSESCRQPTQ
jgi:hypothetical protein